MTHDSNELNSKSILIIKETYALSAFINFIISYTLHIWIICCKYKKFLIFHKNALIFH